MQLSYPPVKKNQSKINSLHDTYDFLESLDCENFTDDVLLNDEVNEIIENILPLLKRVCDHEENEHGIMGAHELI